MLLRALLASTFLLNPAWADGLSAPIAAPQIGAQSAMSFPPIASGGGGLTYAWESSQVQTALFSSSVTFTGLAFGAASSDRIVVACVATDNGGTLTVSTIGGVSASTAVSLASDGITIAYANVPTGTTGSVVFSTTAAFVADATVSIFMMHGQTGGGSATPTNNGATLNTGAEPISLAQTVPSSGVAFNCAAASNASGSTTVTWAGSPTPTADNLVQSGSSNKPILASAHSTASGTPSLTSSGAIYAFNAGTMAYASWAP